MGVDVSAARRNADRLSGAAGRLSEAARLVKLYETDLTTAWEADEMKWFAAGLEEVVQLLTTGAGSGRVLSGSIRNTADVIAAEEKAAAEKAAREQARREQEARERRTSAEKTSGGGSTRPSSANSAETGNKNAAATAAAASDPKAEKIALKQKEIESIKARMKKAGIAEWAVLNARLLYLEAELALLQAGDQQKKTRR